MGWIEAVIMSNSKSVPMDSCCRPDRQQEERQQLCPWYWRTALFECPHLGKLKPQDAMLSQGPHCPAAVQRQLRERDPAHEYGAFHWWPQMNSIISRDGGRVYIFWPQGGKHNALLLKQTAANSLTRHKPTYEWPLQLTSSFQLKKSSLRELSVDTLVKLQILRWIVNRDLRSMPLKSLSNSTKRCPLPRLTQAQLMFSIMIIAKQEF